MKRGSFVCLLIAGFCLLSSCRQTVPPSNENTAEDTTVITNITDPDETTTTTDPIPPDPDLGIVRTLDLTWQRGYVSANFRVDEELVTDEDDFSYSNVFTIPRAGTKVTFADTAASGSGGSGFAGTKVYLFSFWKQDAGEWHIDNSVRQYKGPGYADSAISKITGNGEIVYTYITERDQEHIRICYHSGECEGDTNVPYPTVTYEYTGGESSAILSGEFSRSQYRDLYHETSELPYPLLKDKTINVLGDSYVHGAGLNQEYVWCNLLAAKYGMWLTNQGITGSTVSVTAANKDPMILRYQNLPDNHPDIVILEGGRNDFTQKTPIGENNTTTQTTFKGALTATLRGLREKYPNALIICVTVWRVDDGTIAYGTAMKEVCAYEGIPYFDATDETLTGVHMNDASFRAKYCASADDVSHLNKAGMQLVLPAFEKFIGEQYAEFLK